MLFSLEWLRELCPLPHQAEEVSGALTARGLTVDGFTSQGQDHVLDVDVPANRPDCLGHLGLARELSAAFDIPLASRHDSPDGKGAGAGDLVHVLIEAPDLCRRYTAGVVEGVRVGPSPAWVLRRLEACGLRSINNIVDISNLVLLELGHPIHTFDLERLNGSTLKIRRAAAGETLTTLDQEERILLPRDLVIADADRPVALAGVMGGANTEIRQSTSRVLVEAAWFLPSTVRATSRRLGLKTDASHRFERGADPEGVLEAQSMAARLLAELAGGSPAPGILDVHPEPSSPRKLILRHDKLRTLLGYDPGSDLIRTSLGVLGLAPEPEGVDSTRVTVPSWRIDLEREVDLVEEVARHQGYDRIPYTLPPATGGPSPPESDQLLDERVRDTLAPLGFHEAFNYSMIGENEDAPFVHDGSPAPVALANPIAEPLSILRRSLLPGLVASADRNLRRGVRDVRLFEVGRVFHTRSEGSFPEEGQRAALVWAGASGPGHWSEETRQVELHNLAGVVEALLAALGHGTELTKTAPGGVPGLHPGRSLAWTADPGPTVAWGGELHPSRRRHLDLTSTLFLAELDLSALLRLPSRPLVYKPLPRLPAVTRDLSLVLDRDLAFETLARTLRQVPAPAHVEFEVIDRYEGEPLASHEVSLTVRAILQPLDRSLTDPEIESYRTALVEAMSRQLKIRLRT